MSPFSPTINTLISHISLQFVNYRSLHYTSPCSTFLSQTEFSSLCPHYKTPPCAALYSLFLYFQRPWTILIFLYIRQAAILRSSSACFGLAQTSPIKLRFTVFPPFFGSFTYGTSIPALRSKKEQECTLDDKSSC